MNNKADIKAGMANSPIMLEAPSSTSLGDISKSEDSQSSAWASSSTGSSPLAAMIMSSTGLSPRLPEKPVSFFSNILQSHYPIALYLRSLGVLNVGNNIHALKDLTEDNVLTIQPTSLDGGDEELRSIGILTRVGHRQETGTSVAKLEVLICETAAIDRFATSSVTLCEVTTLDHEVLTTRIVINEHLRVKIRKERVEKYLDYTVELAALISVAFLSGSQGTEVLNSLGNGLLQ